MPASGVVPGNERLQIPTLNPKSEREQNFETHYRSVRKREQGQAGLLAPLRVLSCCVVRWARGCCGLSGVLRCGVAAPWGVWVLRVWVVSGVCERQVQRATSFKNREKAALEPQLPETRPQRPIYRPGRIPLDARAVWCCFWGPMSPKAPSSGLKPAF